MKKEISISEDFWKEFEARGFAIQKESGGLYANEFKGSVVKKHGTKIYQILNNNNNIKITIIDPKLFLDTVHKIENMVNFKLFE